MFNMYSYGIRGRKIKICNICFMVNIILGYYIALSGLRRKAVYIHNGA